MKKRVKMMIIIGSFIVVLILSFVLLDGSFLAKKYQSVWSDRYIDELENDQSKIIASAVRAASSHNTQPWLVKSISTDTIELYADMSKALPVVDGDNKQLLMSQGTFIESFKSGAARYGYTVNIEYNAPDLSQSTPLVTTIKMIKKDDAYTVDAVSSSTFTPYQVDNTDIEGTIDACIRKYDKFSYTIVDSEKEVEKLQEYLLEGTVIESKHEAATRELLDVFRWTEWEKNEYRCGLSLTSMPTLLKPFVQPIMKFSSGDWEAFGESSIKMFKERLQKQHRYILIKCEDPSSLDFIYCGQIYQKLLLETGEVELKPAMQALENFHAMKGLNSEFQQAYGTDGEVMMILGVQESTGTGSNPRHLVKDILID